MPLAVEARGLHKSFGPVKAVRGVDLALPRGQVYALVGPDGAGKTTLIRLLCGVLHPDQGSIRVLDFDLLRQPDQARAHIGYLSQRFSLYEELTVLENLRFFAEVRGLSTQDWYPRSMEVLTFVGLDPFVHRRAGHLSGGMKQKLGLAVALVHRPRILLLDEPTNGVDPITRQEFWQLLLSLVNQEGITALVTTPYMDEAVRAHRVGFMQQGRLLVEGPPEQLRRQFPYAVLVLRGAPLRQWQHCLQEQPWLKGLRRFGDRLHLWVEHHQVRTGMRRMRRLARQCGLHLEALYPSDPQLEDVFLVLLQRQQPLSEVT